MNEPKTPNLGLNKIDRSSPSTTYFDLDKYLDQNWEKVDEGVGQVEEKAEETAAQVSSIQERLDTEKRRSVTLEPGLQIINAERASAFKLEGLKGRTLVNLLGRDGNFGVANNWSEFAGTKAVANNVITVTGNGSDINPQVSNNKFISSLTPKVGDKLFLRVRATPVVGTVQQLQLYLYSANLSRVTAKNISNPLNGTTYDMFGSITVTQAIVDGWDSSLGLKLAATYATVAASNGSQVQYSQAAIYKISEADLSLTDDQVAAKYPYVDSLQPVKNPYAIRYGENLLSPLYDWNTVGINPASIKGAYKSTYTVTNSQNAYYYLDLVLSGGVSYTYSAEHNGYLSVTDPINNKVIVENTPNQSLTFTTTEALTVRIYFSNIYNIPKDGSYFFSNPMLSIGTTAKPFKPREDVMLALQTELYANPLTDTDADEVFEKDGQYFKLMKWKRIALDGTLTHSFFGSGTGFKVVNALLPGSPAADGSGLLTKYHGKIIKETDYATVSSQADNLNIGSSGANDVFDNFQISIANTDSGWGDSYTPTADEIKAYFMGWKMYTGDASDSAYTGSGSKYWRYINIPVGDANTVDGSATSTLPTSKVPNYAPYQLLYKLATPVVEPITSEGQLTFVEGDNQVEVGTGIVLRESVKPQLSGDKYYINSKVLSGSLTKHTPRKINSIFRDSKPDKPKWLDYVDGGSNGITSQIPQALYDPSAGYSFTYLMMDTSPVVSFIGSIADNEKALLMNLTDTVQQNVAALSMLKIAIPSGDTLKNYVDNKPWQKYKITQDNGSVIQLAHSSNLNNIKTGGQYDCFNAINGPGGVANAWFYVEVLVHSNAPTHVIQRASRLDTHNTPTLYMRTCMDNIWSAWSPDVFQSGVNAKNGIVDAVNAMGGSASMNDTWSTLASKVQLIKTGKRFATGQFVIGSNGAGSVTGLGFKPRHITFANATNTPMYIYFGIYSEESPRNNYSLGGTSFFNRIAGLDNGLSVDDKIVPTVDGFNVSGTGITNQRTYNYFATE
ncbi:pyocin knob domain-containing protein [Paenibacillus sp. W2I17]|uniref:pyocin knob domain-containing protein n=2 Tax=Bacteria TaxID=2 RepID=UPI00278B07A1|nr:pyocin knob domain-containing protein [Paenibacillus sp. W2I17]MDQ0658118.1 hypothetical protein [Paenibacillus sp. W2I17]